ncbi:hypothetical protein AcW1_008248 [Taiwanofungus camphoratus]|nr:hypothetical protein AcW1_008248 [Antrodia cinnamomea]
MLISDPSGRLVSTLSHNTHLKNLHVLSESLFGVLDTDSCVLVLFSMTSTHLQRNETVLTICKSSGTALQDVVENLFSNFWQFVSEIANSDAHGVGSKSSGSRHVHRHIAFRN